MIEYLQESLIKINEVTTKAMFPLCDILSDSCKTDFSFY